MPKIGSNFPRRLLVCMVIFSIILIVGYALAALEFDDKRFDSLSYAITALATVILAMITVWAVSFQTTMADRVAQVQMLQAFSTRYEAIPLAKARASLSRMYLLDQKPSEGNADRVLDFFESLAFFVRYEHLRYEVAENEYSLAVRVYWSLLKTYVEKMRVEYADPTFYEHMEWLSNRFQEGYADESASTCAGAKITDKQARGFFESESSVADV